MPHTPAEPGPTQRAPRVVIAGFGDTGMLVAIHLGGGFDILGVSPKPCLVSGQELGTRLTRPAAWKQHYLNDFSRYRQLDGVRILQGHISSLDPVAQNVNIIMLNGELRCERYDILVIASGVTNGFWRSADAESLALIDAGIEARAARLARVQSLAIVGGGATGVSVAANVAAVYPDKSVHLFFSADQPLPGYHPGVRKALVKQLRDLGVHLHPGHRAVIPPGFNCDELTEGAIHWQSGQAAFEAELTLWAVGQQHPNNDFLPADMLDEQGFVRVDRKLRVEGYRNIFALGDIAASDPHRSSARNWGFRLVAHNIRQYARLLRSASRSGSVDDAELEQALRDFSAPAYRWGSLLGVQRDGLRVFQPQGGSYRFPPWVVKHVLFPHIVAKMIYRGMRKSPD